MAEQDTLGTSIRIFLASGEADGVWVVEKSNWTGKALMAPRTRFRDLRQRVDLQGTGVYLLVGRTNSQLPSVLVYIGETDDLPKRLSEHLREKEFWNRVIVFTSKDDNLNKAHIKYLEARLIELATDAKRAELENANVGSPSQLSEPDTAEAEAFLQEMLLIYPVLGVQVFQKADDDASDTVRLKLTGMDASGEGSETADGFVVYKGSLARKTVVASLYDYVVQLRKALIEEEILVLDGDQYRLSQDYLFTSPSLAAMVLLGRSANGRTEWVTKSGVTLKQLQDKEADALDAGVDGDG